MIYRCTLKCPHGAPPCELKPSEYETVATYQTPCPIGEDDWFKPVDETNEFFCLIVFTRTFNNYALLKEKADKMLENMNGRNVVIVSGGAILAERYAKERGYQLIVMEALWDEEGKAAGPKRDERMHQYISTKEKRGVLAFWDGKNKETAHNFGLAQKYNNQIRVIRY